MSSACIAVDMMGGDFGLQITAPAVIAASHHWPMVQFLLVGQPDNMRRALGSCYSHPAFQYIATEEVIAMDESPASALRRKRQSSMGLAIQAVAEGRAQAVVSAGNTGALMALARYIVKTIASIDRPAILGTFPTIHLEQPTFILDLGANVDSSPNQLSEFALMGSLYAEKVAGITKPRIGLLNVGSEAIKGNELVKATHALLQVQTHLNYKGYVEGDDIFKAAVDVVVCDGFIGNVLLKACEGAAKLFTQSLKNEFKRTWWNQCLGWVVKPLLKQSLGQFDPARYNGACLIGLNGIVIKSHGGATVQGFGQALANAIRQVEQQIPEKLRHIEEYLN